MPLALENADRVRVVRPVCTYGLGELAHRLGQDHRSQKWLLTYVAGLIDRHDFPRPLPLQEGGTLHTGPRPRSRWQVASVDAWFDHLLPPGGTSADAAAERAAAADMDERAFHLGGLRLIHGSKAARA